MRSTLRFFKEREYFDCFVCKNGCSIAETITLLETDEIHGFIYGINYQKRNALLYGM